MITSATNPKVQLIRQLNNRRQKRKKEKAFTAEGIRLIEEAWKQGIAPATLFYDENLPERGMDIVNSMSEKNVDCLQVASRVMKEMAQTETPQGIMAIYPEIKLTYPENINFGIILDNIRDPGNLGTLLRTAQAAGVEAVFLTTGTVDPFSPKVLRSGMGAQFSLPIFTLDWPDLQSIIEANPIPLKIVASRMQGIPLWQSDLQQPLLLVIGNEAHGISTEAEELANEYVSIPMPGKIESLNAATAGSILIYEILRQRST